MEQLPFFFSTPKTSNTFYSSSIRSFDVYYSVSERDCILSRYTHQIKSFQHLSWMWFNGFRIMIRHYMLNWQIVESDNLFNVWSWRSADYCTWNMMFSYNLKNFSHSVIHDRFRNTPISIRFPCTFSCELSAESRYTTANSGFPDAIVAFTACIVPPFTPV